MSLEQLKALGEKRTSLYGQISKLRDEFNASGKKWKDGEQAQTWDQVNRDYDNCMGEIESLQQAADVERRFTAIEERNKQPINPQNIGLDDAGGGRVGQRPAPGSSGAKSLTIEQARDLAISGWARAQFGVRPTKREMNAAKMVGLRPNAAHLNVRLPETQPLNALRSALVDHLTSRRSVESFNFNGSFEYNAGLSGVTPSSGASVIPSETLMRQLEVNMLAYGAVRQVAGQIATSSGEPFSWPTADDTSNEGRMVGDSSLVDDNGGAGASGDGGPNPAFGKTTWNAYKFTSDTVLVPFELMEDAAINVAQLIFQMLGERLGRGTNRKFTTGTGAAEPQGIVTGAALGATTATATAITADEVIDLEHSVDASYRSGAGYMLHDITVAAIRKLKVQSGTNQYVWQSNFNSGLPDTLNNRPYTVNNHMDYVGTSSNSKFTMLFGLLSQYKVRRVNQIRIYRLQERYRSKDQDGFVAFVREDGGILNAGTAPIKALQQHS